ncbi:short chain dehydrogenase [compost metagenome]
MTRSLGLDGIEHDVRVVGLHPGATKTERKISQPQARVTKELGDAGRLGGVRRQIAIRSSD